MVRTVANGEAEAPLKATGPTQLWLPAAGASVSLVRSDLMCSEEARNLILNVSFSKFETVEAISLLLVHAVGRNNSKSLEAMTVQVPFLLVIRWMEG